MPLPKVMHSHLALHPLLLPLDLQCLPLATHLEHTEPRARPVATPLPQRHHPPVPPTLGPVLSPPHPLAQGLERLPHGCAPRNEKGADNQERRRRECDRPDSAQADVVAAAPLARVHAEEGGEE